jgi:hypothetical protein
MYKLRIEIVLILIPEVYMCFTLVKNQPWTLIPGPGWYESFKKDPIPVASQDGVNSLNKVQGAIPRWYEYF